ncbi:CBS domain-containing protein [Nakamurella panacisegetis]|uniref:CBS domain-containing protein n=1 Tax=Nakamurella panacisegetis TaxID=1090615 RepID=A0A1H0SXK2_9ACTN|nr:CBS domain-containing protein [Nakamurella panacisegetis]SDP46345.1 CBS domain-containing protein [Nakamurella panacisegetis]
MRARDIMSTPVVSVPPDLSVADAAKLLAQRGFTALPVVDDGSRLVGIVTEADLIRERVPPDPRIRGFAAPVSGTRSTPVVGEVMTSSVRSFPPDADVADIADMMVTDRIRCLPIADDGRVVGVITRRDLLESAVARSDLELQREVIKQLATLDDDQERWQVVVQGGVADIEDYRDSAADREQARVLAEGVPGIVDADVRHQTSDPF